MIRSSAPNFFSSMCFKSLPLERLGHLWRMPNVDIICKCCLLSRGQHRSCLGWAAAAHSKVYAQGFLISSQRAAVSAAVFTTAVGKLNTNLEGSICCPGGPERQSDSVYFTLWCAMITPEISFSLDGGGGDISQTSECLHCLFLMFLFLI